MNDQKPLLDVSIDKNSLYREETFTDLHAGTIKRFVPIKPDGSDDASRTAVFMGQTQIMSGGGPLPIQCMLEVNNLDEAIAAFPSAVNKAVEQLIEEAKKMQREAASRIVVPGQQDQKKIIF
ncbi:MAG: cytoplasmic protein [Deltaproteobacteria bacterium]|nr:cytoplasmic protein [Deltaproteobacteria bacterium]